MAKTKLEECQSCGQQTAEYMEEKGHYKCTRPECGAIWWDIFDRPSSEEGSRGIKCYQCQNKKTMLPIMRMDSIEVYRCTKCGRTLLTH